MSLTPTCPICQANLALTADGEFNAWVCPAGHGRAATLSELYERAQEDEVRELWAIAREACKVGIPGGRACPMCAGPTVSIDVPTDADEAAEGTPGDGPATGTVTVDVCPVDEVIWFDGGEVEALPADLPDAAPTAAEDAALSQIRTEFAKGLDGATDTSPTPGSASFVAAGEEAAEANAWPAPPAVTVPPS